MRMVSRDPEVMLGPLSEWGVTRLPGMPRSQVRTEAELKSHFWVRRTEGLGSPHHRGGAGQGRAGWL